MHTAIDTLKGKRVLVTGADGFLGSALSTALVAQGAKVVAGVGPRKHISRLAHIEKDITVIANDLTNVGDAMKIVADSAPDILFHAAAVVSKDRDPAHLDTIVSYSYSMARNIMTATVEHEVSHAVHVGTIEEYGAIPAPFRESDRACPISPYALGKLLATEHALYMGKTTHMRVNVVRPAAFFGPGQGFGSLIPNIVKAALAGEDFEMNKGEQLRDFVYIDDVIEGLVRVARSDLTGEIMNLGSSSPVTIKNVAEMTNAAMGSPIVIRFGAQPYRPFDPMSAFLESTKAREKLGWEPRISIAEGIKKTVEWYRAHYKDMPQT